MNIIFRVDSSLEIGTGHVMRCLTLAHQLKNDLHSIYFICRDHEGNISDIIKENGFNLILLNNIEVTDGLTGYERWVSVPWGRDADETIAAIETLGKQPDLLIIDHYGIDQKWEKKLHPKVGKVLVIDDLANRRHDCDYLIDQNFYVDAAERYNGLLSPRTRLFLGPSYALLREEFYQARKEVPRKEIISVNSILLFMGGSDSDNITQFILESLHELDKKIKLKVVVGKNNPHKQTVKAYTDILENAVYYEQVDNMAELMLTSDLAIGAGGTTTWERCFLGLLQQ
jgi:UDP-2,4-diacetamido-2,4,6-trideoxy-beta-L-altropyranose hydrolase